LVSIVFGCKKISFYHFYLYMQFDNLLVALDSDILLVTINRPQALNALNQGVMTDLWRVFNDILPTLTTVKGIIITGAGEKAFVAGADIKEFLALDSAGARALAQRGHDLFFAIERCRVPVIAAVNGFALGGGCELAMACHIRIAGEKAKFGQPEVNLGLIPGYGGTQRLTQLVGKGKALELMLTADIIDATEAHRLGLANQVVPIGEEVVAAKAMLAKIAAKAPLAVAKVITCVNAFFDESQNGFAAEVNEFVACCDTTDFKEGATAFVEKRKAVFTGN
jgi:enoyl-CoA hydratase